MSKKVGGVISVQDRHLDIHQYKRGDGIISGLFRSEIWRSRLQQIFQCFSTVPNSSGRKFEGLDEFQCDLLVDRIV